MVADKSAVVCIHCLSSIEDEMTVEVNNHKRYFMLRINKNWCLWGSVIFLQRQKPKNIIEPSFPHKG